MKIDEKIKTRITELLTLGEKVLGTRRSPPPNVVGDDRIDSQLAAQWITSVQGLLDRVFGESSAHFVNFAKHTQGYVTFSNVTRAQGVLKAAADDYSGGHLFNVRHLIEAEVFDDFLEQAEHLLSVGYFQAAAVICGAVLEDSLRALCLKSGIAIPDKPKLDQMNADLAKAGVYDKLLQKRITALADLRNKAAHGEWKSFSKADVEDMLSATRRIVADFDR